MPMIVDVADVAGSDPSVAHYSLRRVRVPVVTAHDIGSPYQHLSVFGDRDFNAIERLSNRADTVVFGPVGTNNAGLSHAITLENVYARAEKRIRKCWRKRRSTGNEIAQSSAYAFAPFREHQPIGNSMSRFQ